MNILHIFVKNIHYYYYRKYQKLHYHYTKNYIINIKNINI